MTDAPLAASQPSIVVGHPRDGSSLHMTDAARARLRRRYAADRRFRLAGLGAVLFGVMALGFLLFIILSSLSLIHI
jgi:phosphate transport system permease protein